MIRQLVLDDVTTGKHLVGLLLTSGDLEDFEVARLGERLLRAGSAAKGHLGRVTYRFEVLDAMVPGLELQTSHVGRTHLLGSHDVLSIDGNKVALIMNDDQWAPWVGQCRPADDHRVRRNQPTIDKRPCDRIPRWLWPLVAVVGLGLIIAGVR